MAISQKLYLIVIWLVIKSKFNMVRCEEKCRVIGIKDVYNLSKDINHIYIYIYTSLCFKKISYSLIEQNIFFIYCAELWAGHNTSCWRQNDVHNPS